LAAAKPFLPDYSTSWEKEQRAGGVNFLTAWNEKLSGNFHPPADEKEAKRAEKDGKHPMKGSQM